jgi:hypothetical protein
LHHVDMSEAETRVQIKLVARCLVARYWLPFLEPIRSIEVIGINEQSTMTHPWNLFQL